MTTSETIQPNSEMNPDQLQSDMNTIKNVLTETDKDQDIHRIIIASGNFLSGFLLLTLAPFLLLIVGIIGEIAPAAKAGEPSPTLIMGGAVMMILMMLLLLSLPFFIAAWGVFKKKSWGSVMAVIAAILNLSNIPLGTALGIYSLWAVSQGKLSTRQPNSPTEE